MADKKISQLTELTTAADDDSLVILDTDADVTKRIEVSNLVGTNSLLLKTASTLTSSPQAVQSVGAQVSALQISSVGVKAAGTLTATGTSTLASATLSGDLTIGTGETVDTILDEDNLGSDDPNALATQQSIKAYVDTQITTEDTLEELNDVDISGKASGDVIIYQGDTWDNKQISGDASMDNTGAVVVDGLQGRSVASTAPSDGESLAWDSGTSTWKPSAGAGTGTVTSVAISGSDGIDVDSGSPITSTGTIALGLSAIPNTSLANSEVTIGSTAISLGATATTIAGLTSVTSTGFTGDLTGNVTATSVLVDGVIGTTQSADDNSTKVATTAYVDAQVETSDTLSEVLANGGTATSSALAGVMSDETGSGSLVFATSPTLVTPALGTPASGTLTNCVFPTLNQDTTGNAGTVTNGVYTTNNLSVLSATTSAQLAGVMSDETGTGSLVFASSPTLVTPLLGTPTSGVATNLTGTASGLTAGNVTTNANLTGDVTSIGNATSIGAGVIVDADVKSDAAIAYSKLGTIPTWNQDTTGTAATVTGATQAAITSAANLVTVGTIGTGVWEGTAVAANKGGTGQTVYAVGDILFADTTTTLDNLAASTDGYVLTATGVGSAPAWEAAAGGGNVSKVGTPADSQVGVWTGDGTLEGTTGLVFDGANLGIGGTPTAKLDVLLGDDGVVKYKSAAQTLVEFWKEGSTEEARMNIKHGGATKIHLRGNGDSYFNGGNVGIGTTVANTKLTVEGTVTLKEQAAADGDTAAYGQIWVKNDAPNTLWFTDDGGNDKQLDTAEIGIAVSDETTALTSSSVATIMIPRKMVLTEVKASLTTKDASNTMYVDVLYNATDPSSTSSILDSSLNFCEITSDTYKGETTAFTGLASSYSLAEDSFIRIEIESTSMLSDQKGLKVWLLGYWE